MTRTFRGKKVLEWKVIEGYSQKDFEIKLNDILDKYEMMDCQYSTDEDNGFSALVLLAEKKKRK